MTPSAIIFLIGISLALAGCGESVSEKRANEARDSNTRQEEAYVDKRLRSLEDRVTALEKK